MSTTSFNTLPSQPSLTSLDESQLPVSEKLVKPSDFAAPSAGSTESDGRGPEHINQQTREGLIAERQAALHFLLAGYNVLSPAYDDAGADIVIYRDGQYHRVQVKKAGGGTTIRLGPSASNFYTDGLATARARGAAEAGAPRRYDLLVIVNSHYIWIIPEAATRGIQSVSVNRGNSKWHLYREERLF